MQGVTEVRVLCTPFGIKRIDIKFKGKELRTLLIIQIRPAILSNLPFQTANLPLNLETIGFQVEILPGFAPKGSPRYLKGTLSCLLNTSLASL
jgi:hypothetical protein